jgi:hypothetical protein
MITLSLFLELRGEFLTLICLFNSSSLGLVTIMPFLPEIRAILIVKLRNLTHKGIKKARVLI